MECLYRFTVQGKGIYEVVDLVCPEGDMRRKEKPDGSWLSKVGKDYPGSVSYWTEKGLSEYMKSGLMEWHAKVAGDEPTVTVVGKPKNILYEDEYQVLCSKGECDVMQKLSLTYFIHKLVT